MVITFKKHWILSNAYVNKHIRSSLLGEQLEVHIISNRYEYPTRIDIYGVLLALAATGTMLFTAGRDD